MLSDGEDGKRKSAMLTGLASRYSTNVAGIFAWVGQGMKIRNAALAEPENLVEATARMSQLPHA